MGCGKSSVGKALANTLEIPFADLDEFIEIEQGRSVREIFQQSGELYFRKLEHKALNHFIQSSKPTVVALGGGTPCYFDNMEVLATSQQFSVYLKGSIPTLAERLMREKDHRPILSFVSSLEAMNEFIGKHLFERSVFYQQAKQQVVIDGKTIDEISAEIKSLLA